MSFPIDTTIPATPNYPGNDQPGMRTNFVNISGFLSVDHVTPGATGNGFHKFVTLNNVAAPGAQTDPISILYTLKGTVSTVSEATYKNQSGVFPVSAIRAFANFTQVGGNNAPQTINQSYNVSSIIRVGVTSSITATLTAGTTVGNTPIVLLTGSNNSTFNYSFNAGVLTITPSSGTAIINFVVLQF